MFDFMKMANFGTKFKDSNGAEWVSIEYYRDGWHLACRPTDTSPAQTFLVHEPGRGPKKEEKPDGVHEAQRPEPDPTGA